MISIATKRQIAIQLSDILSQHLKKLTPVVTAHDGEQILDHGSGTFLIIDGTPIVVTAAHVIKDYSDDMIHIIGTFIPSDYRHITPVEKEFWGGDIGESLDVGYLILPKECIDYFGIESFVTLDRIELYPEKLSTDLTVFYGMPEVLHDHLSEHQDRFQPFMYMAGINDDTDWSKTDNRQLELTMEYPIIVPDTITGQNVTTQNPSGMSGGGIWRSYINRTTESSLYTGALAKLFGIGTDWIESTGNIRANRIGAVMHLLSMRFSSVEKILSEPPNNRVEQTA